MNRRMMVIITLCLTAFNASYADNFPFPRNTIYPFGIMPVARNANDAEAAYLLWKNTYVTQQGAGGFRRVVWDDNSSTVSEGIGYGMLLAANYNDKALFDDLWKYYNLHLDANGLMHWKINSQGVVSGQNAATDADQDVAFALLLADQQWSNAGPSNYLQDAKGLLEKILRYEVEPLTYVLKPGDVWGGSAITNISYFAPAYYRIFSVVTGCSDWERVRAVAYEILQKTAHPVTGLVPDWSDREGHCIQGYGCDYKYDATRTPWRIALDYIWFGESEAQVFTTRITSFARQVGIKKVVDGYRLDGTAIGQWHNSAFVGPFASSCMATGPLEQGFCDNAYQENVSLRGDNYYNMSLKTLTLFLQTGNFFNPINGPIFLKKGFNLFSYPGAVLPEHKTCLALRTALGTADDKMDIMRFNPATQLFENCDSDFPILAGAGYVMQVEKDKQILLYSTPLCPSISLLAGVNLIGFPKPPTGFSCYRLLTTLGPQVLGTVQRFNKNKGAFESCTFFAEEGTVLKPGGEDFPIIAGESYLIHAKAAGTLNSCEN